MSYVYPFEVISIAAATLIPAYIALYLIPNLKFIQTKYIAALGVGLTIWFFFDTFGDANEIDAQSALYPISYFDGWYHIFLILTFLGGIAALAIFDRLCSIKPADIVVDGSKETVTGGARDMRYLIFIPIAIAAVMGIHSLGEGWGYGSTVAAVSGSPPPLNLLLDAFSPGIPLPEAFSPLLSYPLHKFFEATIIACIYTVFIQRSNLVPKESWHIPVLGLLFGLTSVIGASIGYYFKIDTTFFYAFGVTSALYAVIRLGEGATKGTKFFGVFPGYLDGKSFVALGLGFFLLYFAALLH